MVNQSCDYNKEDNIQNTIVTIAFFVSWLYYTDKKLTAHKEANKLDVLVY
jgi:hypothetical protein